LVADDGHPILRFVAAFVEGGYQGMMDEAAREKSRLEQSSRLALLSTDVPPTDLVTVYLQDDNNEHRLGIFCALIPNEGVEESISRPTP
jgi:hypothetical protein